MCKMNETISSTFILCVVYFNPIEIMYNRFGLVALRLVVLQKEK